MSRSALNWNPETPLVSRDGQFGDHALGPSHQLQSEVATDQNEQYYQLRGQQYAPVPEHMLPRQSDAAEYLQILTEIADALGIDDLLFASYSSAIDRIQEDELSQNRSSLHLRQPEEELRTHLLSTQHEEALIRKWLSELQAKPEFEKTTVALERRKATLNAKAKEYQKELETATASLPHDLTTAVSELTEYHKQLRKKERELQSKRAKVQVFQGLPPNLDLARHELRKARDEQMKLIQLREQLLSHMANGVN
ncbi:hypothetical protein OBBRIDRAFT_770162 [Obba rivulosa]|uniref:Uncharacterized protein n=1 Tax=Obba rivulosa TaxID=1052685 RepID=A0A8E2DQZ1_9APHY|nr:hypothetical protein OBBRIDRAFT_770162 [Obba rivulosa]